MSEDLTTSIVSRQNVLNNAQVVAEAQRVLGMQCIPFNGKEYITKAMVARFYDVDIRTIDRYLSSNEDELRKNGYCLLRGIDLSRFVIQAAEVYGSGITRDRVPAGQLGVFDFRAFLNIGMLLVESENARTLRKTILDIVMDFINLRTGGSTRYVNQRDRHFLDSYLGEYDYRKEFTNALDRYISDGVAKYGIFTNMIYKSIFCEKANEYRQILQLKAKDRIRDTFYSEVLDLVAAYEHGFADALGKAYESKGRKLTILEAQDEFARFEVQPVLEPLINQARSKMASRDLAFRDAFHAKLQEYIQPVSSQEIERFFGGQSDDVEKVMSEHRVQISKLSDFDVLFDQLLEENEDVLRRLKERE